MRVHAGPGYDHRSPGSQGLPAGHLNDCSTPSRAVRQRANGSGGTWWTTWKAPGPLSAAVAGPLVFDDGIRVHHQQWVRMESVVKATGDGLRAGLRPVRIVEDEAGPRIGFYQGCPGLVGRVSDLPTGSPPYVAALTLAAARPCIRVHRLPEAIKTIKTGGSG